MEVKEEREGSRVSPRGRLVLLAGGAAFGMQGTLEKHGVRGEKHELVCSFGYNKNP